METNQQQSEPGYWEKQFVAAFAELSARVNENAKNKGFWDKDRNDGEMICLTHGELSEAHESIRKGNPPDDHIPEFLGTEAEFADAIIRIMDHAHVRGWRVAEAIIAKMEYNTKRPRMHGKLC